MEVRTKVIVLARSDEGEYDRRLIVFSENLGKLRVIARGVRRPRAKLASQLELFSLLELYLAGRTIISAQTIDSFPKLRDNIEALEKVFYLADLFNKFIPFEAPEKELFLAFSVSLKNRDFEKFTEEFLRILGFGGVKPKNLKLFLSERLI